jgi:outer membrane lipoprotein-sorting protein
MITARFAGLVFLVSVVTLHSFSFGQCGTPVPTRDPEGLAVLDQMAAATGWTATNLPADAVATGTVTTPGKDNVLSIILKIKGQGQLRTDIQETASTVIINNGQGAVITPFGTRFLPDVSALAVRPFTMPAFSDVGVAANDPNVSIAYVGKDTVNGQSTKEIQVARQVDPCSPLAAFSKIFPITVWVDASSGLPVQIQYAQTAADNQNASSSRIRQFSNYKVLNGIAVAFTQVEVIDGQTSATWQVNDVRFNVGLTDGEFALPNEQ